VLCGIGKFIGHKSALRHAHNEKAIVGGVSCPNRIYQMRKKISIGIAHCGSRIRALRDGCPIGVDHQKTKRVSHRIELCKGLLLPGIGGESMQIQDDRILLVGGLPLGRMNKKSSVLPLVENAIELGKGRLSIFQKQSVMKIKKALIGFGILVGILLLFGIYKISTFRIFDDEIKVIEEFRPKDRVFSLTLSSCH